jgi:methyltransferase (TIGR00027 family)
MIKKAIPEGLYEYVIARTGYYDDLFIDFLKQGIPQIVILGAGYDSRPYRYTDLIIDTLIYEVDALATQEHKRLILQNNQVHVHKNIRYVSIDFEQDNLMNELCKEGFNPVLQTLFIWEGVTFYLNPATVKTILQSLRSNLTEHSILSFDFQNIDKEYGLIDTGLKDETIRFGIEARTIREYLKGLGYAVIEHVDSEEMCKRYLTRSDGSRLGSINSIMNIVKAEMMVPISAKRSVDEV